MYELFSYHQNISQLFLIFLYLCDGLSQRRCIMDIDLFSKMIKELILDNDRVVLPGLGCFVAEMVPATFSDKGYTINPPYRRLYFRSKPDTDDALVNFYAQSNGLDRGVACRILGDFIAELRTIICSKKMVVLPGLGRLRATKENNIFFIADEDLDIYPAGFGLEPISLKTHKETDQEVSAAVVGLRSILDEVPVNEPVPVKVEPVEPVIAKPEIVEQESEEPVGTPSAETTTEEVAVEEQGAEEIEPKEEIVEPATEVVIEQLPEVAESETEPLAETVVEPVAESVAEPETVEAVSEESPLEPMIELAAEQTPVRKTFGKKLLITLGALAAIAVILLIAYVIAARVSPEWIDSILYTPEELEIINRII